MIRLLALPLLLAACAGPPACQAPLSAMVEWSLFMGGDVTGAAWDDFARRSVEPAFPQGFTVLDAAGAWQGGRERSRVLQIVAADSAANAGAVAAIAAFYRTRFAQESVGIVRAPVCARF